MESNCSITFAVLTISISTFYIVKFWFTKKK
ncbi:hypothetical protein B0H69_002432 [Clostridium beijerinckii]|nr:hypothetical protein [Clostridium beijerinckii]NRT68145.1 hypothetical protein [Clostridium beijerinckii]NRT85825.1 hypothetical protein [Clostridium beijerinckii]NRU47723.1 hypothetical protein [Clostridium beijerinckii]NRZ34270.1 hypothetical protein [Clostridium beijerinckii]